MNCLVAHVAHIHGAQRDRNLNFRISVVYGTVVRPQAQDVGRARVSLRGSTATQVAKSSGHGIVTATLRKRIISTPAALAALAKLPPPPKTDAVSPLHCLVPWNPSRSTKSINWIQFSFPLLAAYIFSNVSQLHLGSGVPLPSNPEWYLSFLDNLSQLHLGSVLKPTVHSNRYAVFLQQN